MAQAQQSGNKAKQPKDLYAQRTKTLTSSVQRIRGWVGSDPSRTAELADALVELTDHRLLGHGYAAAAADAQEAVKLSAQLLTAGGPIGPYTAMRDATRYVTAVVQLATVQVGLGLPDAAGRSIESLAELRGLLGADALAVNLSAVTAVRALSCSARAALAAGDVAAANAYADAAEDRLTDGVQIDEPAVAYLVMDTDRVAADARWAAGDTADSLSYLLAARRRYDEVVDGRLAEPARLGEGLRERLVEPLAGLYTDLADRLAITGERDLALSVRRELAATLRRLSERTPETTRRQLAAALTGLAADLTAAGRTTEAAKLTAESVELRRGDEPAEHAPLPAGEPVRWSALDGSAAYAATTGGDAGRAARDAELRSKGERWRESARAGAEQSEAQLRAAAGTEAERERAALAAEQRAAAERAAAEQAERERRARLEAEQRAAASAAERQERQRRRAERIEEHRRLAEQEAAERRAAERAADEQPVADPAEMERLELERLQAEIDALDEREREQAEAERHAAERAEEERLAAERAEHARQAAERAAQREREAAAERRAEERREAERIEAERERAEAERAERERLAAERREEERRQEQRIEAERVEAERVEAERVEAERVEAERVEAERIEAERIEAERIDAERVEAERVETEDDLTVAWDDWNAARSRGDRRATRAANERVVELLRPRAEADPAGYGPSLVAALEDLSRARLRGGDLFGSRGAAKEAKTLAKTLNP